MTTYKVVEIFESINGEGKKAGQLAVFVRFQKCNLNCSYCDTRWANADTSPYTPMTTEEIYNKILYSGITNITITGGEPLLQNNIEELLIKLGENPNLKVEIETNGSINLKKFSSLKNPPSFTMDYKAPSSNMEKFMDLENFSYLTNNDTIKFNSEIGKDKEFDRILHSEDGKKGLPSGYKLGTEDGDIVARWDNSNSEPIYPESAQAKGLHGTVKIRMNIDEYGNVKSLKLEKGSGVPEINNAIEKVGRTWKIYLSKNGLNVQGDVILEYNFILK